ncbi:MAG TPA: hypothetical protein VIW73_11210 [Candidatus Cybelea sp.]
MVRSLDRSAERLNRVLDVLVQAGRALTLRRPMEVVRALFLLLSRSDPVHSYVFSAVPIVAPNACSWRWEKQSPTPSSTPTAEAIPV